MKCEVPGMAPATTARLILTLGLMACLTTPAMAGTLIVPRLTVPRGGAEGPKVALTLDACGGPADERILSALIRSRIPATIFVTASWLRRNPAALAELKAHPRLFEIENHGMRHVPAVDLPIRVYGLPAAGSLAAVRAEIEGGAAAVTAATGKTPHWFRGATGMYTATAIRLIHRMKYELAGYSLAADGGALLSAATTARRIGKARDGDVILAHVNQPGRMAGKGVIAGILALKARGFRFVRLDDAGASVTATRVPIAVPPKPAG